MNLRRDERPVQISLREISGHLVTDGSKVTAWYLLPNRPWSFESDGARLDMTMLAAGAYAGLLGNRVHLRVTSRPFPVSEWAKALDDNTPHPVGGKEPGSPWDRSLVREQQALVSSSLADKEVYFGVEVAQRGVLDRVGSALSRTPLSALVGDGTAWVTKLAERLEIVDQIVASPGLEGASVSAEQMEWLVRRSVGLHLPAPSRLAAAEGSWSPDDVPLLSEGIVQQTEPLGKVTRLVSDGVERYVAVLTLARCGGITVADPGRDPWMVYGDRICPVEWSSRVDLLHGHAAQAEVGRRLLLARDMEGAYAEHGLDVPPDVARKAARAIALRDQMTEGGELESARAYGWHRLAVSGRTEKECLNRVRDLTAHYQRMSMTLAHPAGQQALLREFIPCEPLASTAYKRRFPLVYFAAAVPTAASTLGDKRGFYLADLDGPTRRPVMFDPHYGPEVAETSGLTPIVGVPGCGKSVLLGRIAANLAERGVPTTLWDPSGPLAALVTLPSLTGRARHIDLNGAQPGTLTPYAVVPEPRRANYPDDDSWHEAKAIAAVERRTLTLDVCRSLLPAMLDEQVGVRVVLTDAIRHVGGDRTSSLWEVINALEADTRDEGKMIANYLRDASEIPKTRLFFPSGWDKGNLDIDPASDLLTVITMAGLDKPDASIPRSQWSTEQAMAFTLLNLAIYHTSRRIYSGNMKTRKAVLLDEASFLSDWPSGRALLLRLATDSRKWDAFVAVASQNAGHVLSLNISNLIGSAFVGRTEAPEHAGEALSLLGVPTGVGYERTLSTLSPRVRNQRAKHRDFVMRDVYGYVEKIRVGMGNDPEIAARLNTTADPLAATSAA